MAAAPAPGHMDVLILNEQAAAPGTLANHFQVYGIVTATVPYTDKTATMTTNTNPSPNVASASGEYDASHQAWKPFSKAGGTDEWISAVKPSSTAQWLKYYFGSGSGITATKYAITQRTGESGSSPKNFTLAGSNDNSAWTTLDTHTDITWSAPETKTFAFANATKYDYYKLTITTNQTDDYCTIGALQLQTADATVYTYSAKIKDPGGTEHVIF